jgi:hypothetical protein
MNRNSFKSVYGLANSMYGVTMDIDTFEDIALNGWELIGNKQTRLHRFVADTENGKIKLPCNVDIIEAVYIPGLVSQETSNAGTIEYINRSVEFYIESQKKEMNPFYNKGHLAKYRIEGDYIVLDKDYNNVTIIYHGIILDEEGLPYLSDKEVQALAAYVAYVQTYKKSLIKSDGNLVNLANVIKSDWVRLCNSARIPNHITQNDMNDVLDVKTRWDRKMYSKSFNVLV